STVLTNDTIEMSDFQLFDLNCSLVLASSERSKTLMMPLMMHTFDSPHILTSDNHWLAFYFQPIDISSSLFVTPQYVIVTHDSEYNAFISMWGLSMIVVTVLFLNYTVYAVV